MCNHSYKNFSVNKKNHLCDLEKSFLQLPTDEEGKCLFHSKDKGWKQAQDFTAYLRRYVVYCREHKQEIDLREVHFVSAQGKTEIDYIDILGNAEMEDAEFHNTILMVGKNKPRQISGKLNFTNCIFYYDVIFKHCMFLHEVEFAHITMENEFGVLNLQMENCIFKHYFDCNYQEDCSAHITIADCKFKEDVRFQSVHKVDNCFDIVCNTFYENFTFTDSEINAPVINFSNNIFHGDAEFNNVAFKGLILFNQPKVESKLIFNGTSERKIFYGQTQFNLEPDDVQGQIIFQQTNLMLIDSGDLEVLKKLEKTGVGEAKKVVIGAGCIKYRWQTLPKTLKTGMKNGFIIEEFTRSFTIFLSNSIQKVIGIEILDRTSTEITFFYFSDEEGTDEEFMNALMEGRQDFFCIVNGNRLSESTGLTKSNAFNQFQTKLSQNATILKVITELMQQNWKLKDTQALLDAFTFPDETLISAEPLHKQLSRVNIEKLLNTSQQSNIPLNLISLNVNLAETIIDIDQMNGNIHSGK